MSPNSPWSYSLFIYLQLSADKQLQSLWNATPGLHRMTIKCMIKNGVQHSFARKFKKHKHTHTQTGPLQHAKPSSRPALIFHTIKYAQRAFQKASPSLHIDRTLSSLNDVCNICQWQTRLFVDLIGKYPCVNASTRLVYVGIIERGIEAQFIGCKKSF